MVSAAFRVRVAGAIADDRMGSAMPGIVPPVMAAALPVRVDRSRAPLAVKGVVRSPPSLHAGPIGVTASLAVAMVRLNLDLTTN